MSSGLAEFYATFTSGPWTEVDSGMSDATIGSMDASQTCWLKVQAVCEADGVQYISHTLLFLDIKGLIRKLLPN